MSLGQRLQAFVAAGDAQHVLVLRMEDIRWLTGFTGSTAFALVDRFTGTVNLFVDSRYVERAQHEVQHAQSETQVVETVSGRSLTETLTEFVSGELSVDLHHVTAARFKELSASFQVIEETGVFNQLRRVKDDREIAAMARAASIADVALAEVLQDGFVGNTERQIRNRLDAAMRHLGADTVSFDTIVATGPNGARPHHEPSDTVIESGHAVVVDMGAEVDGYRSDMTRTIQVGHWSHEIAEMYRIVREAQAHGVSIVRDGVVGRAVDDAVRDVFRREGVEHEYLHGTGHGVGLYIHEEPILSPRCEAVLSAGEVVTVEPGLYRKGVGGVRIEDQVVVTGTGCRILTLSPKELSCPRSQQTI
ncbi:MAG: M24 family metallopeptidase [Ilumatobacteraceae bacterium]